MDIQKEKISVLIPYKKQNDSQREMLWMNIKQRYEKLMPELEICIGLDDSLLFNRSRAINRAAKSATGDVFIISNADVIFSREIISNIIPIMHDYPWIVPYTSGYKLTRAATQRLIFEGLPDLINVGVSDIEASYNVPASFLCVIPRKNFYKIRGMDERFEGCGVEDAALRFTLDSLCGKNIRISGEVFHLWHKPEQVNKQDYEKNYKLLEQYLSLLKDKDALLSLVNEKNF